MHTEWLTVTEIARTLKVNKSKVRYWIASGLLLAYNVGSGQKRPRLRVKTTDLDTFLLTRQARPIAPVARRHYHSRVPAFDAGDIEEFV